jgi:hypothetical protein
MFDISKLTPQQLDQFISMQRTVEQQKDEAARITSLREYYDGDHPVLLTRRQREYIGDLLAETSWPFAHNHVKSVIDTLRERLSVTGVNIDGVEEGDTTSPAAVVQAAMWDWWTKGRLDAQQIRLYRRALRDGSAFIIVDYDAENQRPRFTVHKLDAGDEEPGIVTIRDPSDENRVLCRIRYFHSTPDPLHPGEVAKKRRTIYLPNQVQKYVMGKVQWEPIMDDGDAGWPLPWTDRTGAPLGVAAVGFDNPGGSEVAQIIGLQNALNKAWLDLIAAADTSGFPIPWVSYEDDVPLNAESDADNEGSNELRLSPGRLLEVVRASVGRIEAADMSQMIAVIDRIEQAISGVSRTPAYYLRPVGGADVPSGEALKQLESGLVRRAEERQLVFGQAWEDVFALAYRVNQAFGPSLPDVPDMTINVTWADANVRNELATAQVAEAHKRLEVPNRKIWAMLEYTPEEIAEFEQAQQQTKQADIAMVTAALRTDASRQGAQTNGGTNGRTNPALG